MRVPPLVHAVQAYERSLDTEAELMFQIAGQAAFDPFDEVLCDTVTELVRRAFDSISGLSPRAKHARLNLIWKDFVTEQKEKRRISSNGVNKA